MICRDLSNANANGKKKINDEGREEPIVWAEALSLASGAPDNLMLL